MSTEREDCRMRLKTDHNVSLTIWLSLTVTMLTGVWKGSVRCWYAALQTQMRRSPDTSLPSSGEEEGQRRKGRREERREGRREGRREEEREERRVEGRKEEGRGKEGGRKGRGEGGGEGGREERSN